MIKTTEMQIRQAIKHCEDGIRRATNFTTGIEWAGGCGGPTWVMIDAVRTDIQEAQQILKGLLDEP